MSADRPPLNTQWTVMARAMVQSSYWATELGDRRWSLRRSTKRGSIPFCNQTRQFQL